MSEQNEVYRVLIAMNLRAPSPGDAVAGMVEQFNEKGLRNWAYRVDAVRGEDLEFVGYFNGRGESRESVAPSPTRTVELPSLSTPVVEVRRASSEQADTVRGEGGSDAELTAYAEHLTSEA